MLMQLVRSGGLALAGGNAVQAGIAFAANLVLVRFVAPDGFGRFAVAVAGVNLALSLLSLRVNMLIIRCPQSRLDARRCAVYHSVSVAESVGVAGLMAVWLAATGSADGWTLALLGGLSLGHALGLNKAFFERSLDYRRIAACETGATLAGHAVSVAAVLAGLGPAALYLREAASALVQAVLLRRAGALSAHPLVWPTAAEWRAVLAEARGVWADGVLEGAFTRVVLLGTAAFGGERAAGLLAQAQRLAVIPHQLLGPIVTRVAAAWFGQAAEDPARRAEGRRRLLAAAALPLAIAAAATVLLADPVVPWLFGEAWHDAAPLLAALAGMVLFTSLFEISRAYALSARRTVPLLAARLSQYAGLGLGFALAADPGRGAALGLSAAAFAAFAVLEALLRLRPSGEG